MADYDTDESNVEFLIQHMPLADVLAFVEARDEVRRIPAPPLARDENDDMLAPPSRQTMPAAVGRVVSAIIEVEPMPVSTRTAAIDRALDVLKGRAANR